MMCGICGKIYFDSTRTVAARTLREMAAMLAHRGPDGEGAWVDQNVGLAHRRLAIIDLRPEAGQPMCNEDGTVWITFNGEIYNFQELRQDLEGRGHVFKTSSDTEAIVHAYEEYGRECLSRLRGMFAFAIWDKRAKVLFLARDRVGKKPLYYFLDREKFLFASAIKAILADGSVPAEPDPTAIDHFVALGYVPAPLAAFRGVRKLPAGHWLEVRNGRLEMGRYWKLHYRPKSKITMQDAIAELQWRIAEAVRVRLVSDVPLGVFLSGGIDSSAVVAHMARTMDRPVRTFSVGFEDEDYDERRFARLVAQRFSTEHTELVVKAPVVDILPKLIWHYDEPFGDSSAVPSYAIAELTRQHVTVVLNGDGGDESFAGYDRYVASRRAPRGDLVPAWIRRKIWNVIDLLPADWRRSRLTAKLARVSEAMAQPPDRRYAEWMAHCSTGLRGDLYSEAFRETVAGNDPMAPILEAFAQTDAEDWTDATLDNDVSLYLPDDLLVKMDRATMAHSLEARSPLLDHTLMEFVATLPATFKLSGANKKRILKDALRGVLPDIILNRPKMGFGAPIASWFRNELREMAFDLLLSNRAMQRGYFRPDSVRKLLAEHCSNQKDHGQTLWDLLVLELWHRSAFDGKGPAVVLQTANAEPMLAVT
jgi:asparagine synthase (glutamine-hydrolysing)